MRKQSVIEWLGTWFDQHQKNINPKQCTLPWWSKGTKSAKIIETPHQLTKLRWSDLAMHLPRLFKPNPNDGRCYTSIHMGCHEDFHDAITNNVKWFYNSNKGGLYNKPINDAENLVNFGLFTLTGQFSTPESHQQIVNNWKKKNNCKFLIGCR